MKVKNLNPKPIDLQVIDLSYGQQGQKQRVQPNEEKTIVIDLKQNHGWYDFVLKTIDNNTFERRFAGRVETEEMGFTDPSMS